ncbi:MAG: cyclase family protein [Spirochaetaceae bacterium]|nr:cyclase family protein [Spirochaetaceae bacterium]
MKVLDLTHLMEEGMPVYPGTEQPSFSGAFSVTEHGFREARLTMLTHTGTHLDAPAHILNGGSTLEKLPVDAFVGQAAVIDVSGVTDRIEKSALLHAAEDIAELDFVILRTGWEGRWGVDSYFSGFPTLSPDAARWLTGFRLKGIGFDCISADAAETTDFEIHKIVLGAGIIIIENLRGLDALPDTAFRFAAFPLKLKDGDGSPVRAVGMWDEN